MKKEKIIKKTILKLTLDSRLKKLVNQMLTKSKTLEGKEFVSEIKEQVQRLDISNEDFAKIVESFIRQHQLHLKDDAYKKSLKELASKPPLKTYLSGLTF